MGTVLTWALSGTAAGWLARFVIGGRREFGLIGDLILGSLGGLVGGWLLKYAGITPPDLILAHVLVAVSGAAALVGSVRLLRGVVVAGTAALPASAGLEMDLEQQVRSLGDLERRVLARVLGRRSGGADPNRVFDDQMTLGQRVADHVASFGGSWTFIGLFFVVLVAWMIVNQEMSRPFDPYPFILLNLVLSCIAALQAPVIMMSQNRMAVKDRLDARSDYEVNMRAEVEIMGLHEKIDAVRDREWTEFLALQREQLEALRRIERHLFQPTSAGSTDDR